MPLRRTQHGEPLRKGCSDIGQPLRKDHLKVPFSLEQGTKHLEVDVQNCTSLGQLNDETKII